MVALQNAVLIDDYSNNRIKNSGNPRKRGKRLLNQKKSSFRKRRVKQSYQGRVGDEDLSCG